MNILDAQLLEDAAEIVEEGWCQGGFRTFGGPQAFCAVGALTEARMRRQVGRWSYWDSSLPYRLFGDVIELPDLLGIVHPVEADTSMRRIACWNDAEERTAIEVRDALMLGAKKLRDMGR